MKKLTTDDGMNLLVDIIANGKRHRDYDRVKWMARLMKSLVTGEDMEWLMRKFTRREDDDMFEQRMEITQHITSTVCENLIDPEFKIPRSNGVRRVLRYIDDNENQNLREFEAILGKFYGNQSLDDYLGDRWIELANIDPNSFLVYEWGCFDENKERAKPYPFEVSAEEAIYYEFKNNILQFLVVKNDYEKGAGHLWEEVDENDLENENRAKGISPEIITRYTMYFTGYSITFDQIDDESAKKVKARKKIIEPTDLYKYTINDKDFVEIKGKLYRVGIFESKLDFIPVERVGYKYDPVTRRRTCIPSIWAAVPLLKKTIKANSELDLTMSLSAHPQKIQYVRACQAENCNQGRLPSGGTCKVCKGTGVEDVATTAQEFIKLIMPRDKEEMIPLDDIVRYITPPTDILAFQEEYIKALTAQCKEAIYNSEIFSRQQIAETATGKNIDLQNVYDALYPMAKAFAYMWERSIHAISKITDKDKNLVYAYIFSKDFKMKSMSELIMDLKTATDSKADAFVKQGLQDDIAQIQYTDDPKGYARYKAKDRFFPYSGQSKDEIATIVTLAPPTDFHRVLWEMYGWIFEELEREFNAKGKNFYDMSYDKQWKAIEKKVNKKIEERQAVKETFKPQVEE